MQVRNAIFETIWNKKTLFLECDPNKILAKTHTFKKDTSSKSLLFETNSQ